MRLIGNPEVEKAFREQGDSFVQKISCMIVHSNRYGWAVRLGGWTGPKMSQHDDQSSAEECATAWVAESPSTRVAFVSE